MRTLTRVSVRRERWLEEVLSGLAGDGFAIVEDVVGADLLERTREAMYRAQARIRDEIGAERLARAGEIGVLRLMLHYDEHFFSLLELEPVLAIVDATLSRTAILHLQNGLILPPCPSGAAPEVFQTRFHRDFPRYLNGYVASVNTFLAIDEFTEDNGATLLVPGTHQLEEPPPYEWMREHALPALCPAGSVIVFDSTLWHAAGPNRSGRDRLAINQQFTHSYIKQQIDYVRALGDAAVTSQPPRTQQLLGWYTRVVTSLAEYYLPSEQRLYRGGQG